MKLSAYCAYPFQRIRATSEGNLAMCCYQRPDPKSLVQLNPYIGNIFENNFDAIWFGSLAASIREEVLAGRLHKKCNVPDCPFLTSRHAKEFIYNEYPTFLEIDLPNTHCNVGGRSPNPASSACIMCDRADPKFIPDQDHLFDVLERIKHIVPNLSQIHIQGVAEPIYRIGEDLLLFKVLDALGFDKYSEKIVISIMTNGIEFDAETRKEFFARIPRSVTSFSIDAASSETFRKIRILDCFEKVLEHFYFFSKERVSSRQFLLMHNNINLYNVHEVQGMVYIAHAANVDYAEFNPTGGFNESIQVNNKNCGMFKRAQGQIAYECERLKVPVRFIRPLDLGLVRDII